MHILVKINTFSRS